MSRFDIVLGHYVFCSLHHSGQWSPLYARLCRIGLYFNPGVLYSESRVLDPGNPDYADAREVYAALCAKHGVEE